MQTALSTLYEASLQLYPAYQEPFATEDYIIRHFTALEENNPSGGAGKFLRKLGMASDKITDILGNVLNSGSQSHWFKPDVPYAIVGHALEHPRSAAALATRLWQSLVSEGNDKLTVDDLAEVLGPHKREDAEKYFKVLDENENKDIELDELVLTVVELGRIRHAIFQGMNDMNHAINTFDWIALTAIGFTMIFFICKSICYYSTLKCHDSDIFSLVVQTCTNITQWFFTSPSSKKSKRPSASPPSESPLLLVARYTNSFPAASFYSSNTPTMSVTA